MPTPYSIEVFNMTLPPEGPGVIPINHQFDGVTNDLEIDLTQIVNDGLISYVSGVQIDTLEAVGGNVLITVNASGQRVVCGAGKILIWPLCAPNPPLFTVTAQSGLVGAIRLHFVNFPVFYGATAP